MTHEEFVLKLATYYGEKNDTKIAMTIEWVEGSVDKSMLGDLMNKILGTETFFPVAPVIKKHIDNLTGNTADHAYKQAMKAVRRLGSYGSVKFENGRIAETIRIVWSTWLGFCCDTMEDQWRRKKFIEIYNGLNGSEYPGSMAGSVEGSGSQYFKLATVDGGGRLQIESADRKQLEDR